MFNGYEMYDTQAEKNGLGQQIAKNGTAMSRTTTSATRTAIIKTAVDKSIGLSLMLS